MTGHAWGTVADVARIVAPAVAIAASCGLRAFLPALALAVGAHLGAIHPSGPAAWLASDAALWILGAAAAIEILGDKVPVVDHALDVLGTLVRPVAAALLAIAWYGGVSPDWMWPAAIVTGAGAFAVHAIKAKTRIGSTVLTLGHATPLLSLGEDVASAGFALPLVFGVILLPFLLLTLVAAAALLLVYRRRRPAAIHR